jgi:hypothetical protein
VTFGFDAYTIPMSLVDHTRPMFRRVSLRFVAADAMSNRPSFEIYKLADKPEDGHLTRVTYMKERGSIVISRFPQLGPRKEDPTDNQPQFDVSRRISARLTMPEIGACLAVLEGKAQNYKLPGDLFDVQITRSEDGFRIKGTMMTGPRDNKVPNAIDFTFDSVRTTQLYYFFDTAVKDSLDFRHR